MKKEIECGIMFVELLKVLLVIGGITLIVDRIIERHNSMLTRLIDFLREKRKR